MRHSLYKYFDQLKWAEKFLEGEMLFRPLSYSVDAKMKHEGMNTKALPANILKRAFK